MTEPDTTLLERRFLREIAEIDAKIAELKANRTVLERLLLKARRENISLRDVSRKNSVGRILVENAILDALKASPKPLRNAALLAAARFSDPDLKDSTFRSHLRRLKLRGVIANHGNHTGTWKFLPHQDAKVESPAKAGNDS